MPHPSKNRLSGKENERAIAKRLGGQRMGILGQDDVRAGIFSIEAKKVKRWSLRESWIDQMERNCPPDMTPLLIIHKTHQHRDNDLVCMKLKDFEEWYGKLKTSDQTSAKF